MKLPSRDRPSSIDGRSQRNPVFRILFAVFRMPITACRFFLAAPAVSTSRRALLQGKFWRLSESTPSGSRSINSPSINSPSIGALVTRYPTASDSLGSESQPPRTIHGISIEPVPATDLSVPSAAEGLPVFRPPGAVAEDQFLRGCTRCGDCIVACPHDAIQVAPDRFGAVAGSPIIDADTQACRMCEDFPCIASCKPGVLTHAVPVVMGTARITEQLCLAYQGTICTVCSERCPVSGAIQVTGGRSTIAESVCTGCGICRYVCPAPENAILLMPTLERTRV